MKVATVIPNWNGKKSLKACLDSLSDQVEQTGIIVVDNGSNDGSADFIIENYPDVNLIRHERNLGFAGGVNSGIKYALNHSCEFVALLNNDASVDKDWLKNLLAAMEESPKTGIVTSKILDKSEKRLDSTGDTYSMWGLPFPRGRGEMDKGQYDEQTEIFGASGGASLYRIKTLQEIGLFDEDFFAYYEDIDISFRAQLAGWQVRYQPKAIVYHSIGETSRQIPGFTTYQTLKNLPMLLWKNVPLGLLPKVLPRFVLAYSSIYFSALARGQFGPATKGLAMSIWLWPKKLFQRWQIQSGRKVSTGYIESILIHDLPPNAHKLRRLRRVVSLGRIK